MFRGVGQAHSPRSIIVSNAPSPPSFYPCFYPCLVALRCAGQLAAGESHALADILHWCSESVRTRGVLVKAFFLDFDKVCVVA